MSVSRKNPRISNRFRAANWMLLTISIVFLPSAQFAVAEDIFWDNATGGDWTQAANWDPLDVPDNATEDVIITLPGTYAIVLDTDIVAGSMTLTNPTATIEIAATSTADRSLILAGDSLINGTINLTSDFSNDVIFQRNGTITNNGTFNADGSSAGLFSRQLSVATFNNNMDGIVNVETGLWLGQFGSVFNNAGTVQLAPNAFLYLETETIFNQDSGVIDNQGYFRARDFNFNGGTLTGNPISLSAGTLTIAPGNTNAGEFTFESNGSYSGDLAAAQTLNIEASSVVDSTVTATDDFTNNGIINLRSDFANNAAILSRSGTITNKGVLNAIGLADGLNDRQLNVDTFDNTASGSVNLLARLYLDSAGAVFNNSGTLHVATDGSLYTEPSVIINQNGGTLDNQGYIRARNFNFNGGSLTGNAINLVNGALEIAAGNTNPGSFVFQGSVNNLTGSLAPAQTLTIETTNVGDTELTLTQDFTNDGTVNLRSDYGGNDAVFSRAGVVTNNGTFNMDGSSGSIYARQLDVDVFENSSAGTINVLDGGLWLDQEDSVFNNSGTFHISLDGSVYMDTSAIFNQNGGTLDNQGFIWAQTFNFNGGTTTGNPVLLLGGTLNIAPGNTNAGSFLFQGKLGNYFSGDLAASQTLKIESTNVQETIVTVNNDLSNQGTIVLRSDHDGEDATLNLSGVITNDGLIEFRGTAAANRTVFASLTNTGTVASFGNSTIGQADSDHVNTGLIRVNGPAVNLLFDGDSFSNEIGGVIQGVGTVEFGTDLPAISRGTISPGHSSGGRLTLDGDMILQPESTLEIQLGGTTQGTSYDFLDAEDFLGLGGSLNVTLINGFESSISSSDVFTIVSAGFLFGQFDTIADGDTLTTTDGRWQFDVNYVSGSVVLSNATMNDFLVGDVNQDGNVDLLDVAPFVTLVADGTYQVEGDINQDGNVDLLDVTPFIELLAGN